MSWYSYCQNNSGGSHEYDASRGISVNVYIEADSADEASERASEIGLYFNGVAGGWDCDGDSLPGAWGQRVPESSH